jgi:hypothetical protein
MTSKASCRIATITAPLATATIACMKDRVQCHPLCFAVRIPNSRFARYTNRRLLSRLALPPFLLLLLAHAAQAQDFFPLRNVRPGLHGVGRTVFQGNRVEEFQVEILGVLENLTPKQSIVLARLSGGPLAQTGVMQGMSGSPVYIDGKLLGAIALGFPYSKEPIAGIQPIEPMIADANVAVPPASRSVETFAENHREEYSMLQRGRRSILPTAEPISVPSPLGNLSEILTPLSVSGFTAATMRAFAPEFRRLGLEPQQGVSSGTPQSQQYSRTVAPGSMISVCMLSGDMNISADGTVTYVNGNRIYAFGHRLLDTGSTELPFARSEVIAIVPTLNSSFKVSAPRQWVGTILSDRATAISGEVGRAAHTVPLSVSVRSGSTASHDYHFRVINSRLLTPVITQTALFSVVDATERTLGAGTIRLTGRVQFENNFPDLVIRDTFVSDNGVAQQVSSDAVVALGFVLGGGFSRLHLQNMSFELETSETKRQLRLAQAWTSAHEVRPGDSVEISALLQGENGMEVTKTTTFRVPSGASDGPLNFTVSDGNTLNFPEFAGLSQSTLQSPAQLIQVINRFRDSESLYVRIWRQEPSFSIGGALPGGELTDPPPSVALILADPSSSATSNAALTVTRGSEIKEISIPLPGYVVTGAKTVQVEVKE